ncbi:hypothetical protein MKEN_00449000 [Mycena kentingensis (nom. inval.)]|nr:hypothetical protein MKEN_00449000 [Mycena kentingensis (nom. inval.)]
MAPTDRDHLSLARRGWYISLRQRRVFVRQKICKQKRPRQALTKKIQPSQMIPTNMNPYSSWGGSSSSSSGATSPIYGALPYPRASGGNPAPSLATFHLTSFSPTILNSWVIGASAGQAYYQITTDKQMVGYTVIKTVDGRSVALVEWQKHPRVEVRGAVEKQDTREWLRISRDKTYRTMTLKNLEFKWIPEDKYINLYSKSSHPQFYGRISRAENAVVIEVTGEAMQMGLLDGIVTAAVILQCGQNID